MICPQPCIALLAERIESGYRYLRNADYWSACEKVSKQVYLILGNSLRYSFAVFGDNTIIVYHKNGRVLYPYDPPL